MSDMPPDLRELYFTFGVTAEKAQLMETAAGTAIVAYVAMFIDTDNITPEITAWCKQLLDDVNSKTFGAVLKTIKKSVQIDEKALAIINDGLKKRNYITHKFYRHHNFAINSEEGRRAMIDDLSACGKKFDITSSLLDGLTGCFQQSAGRPADFGLEDGQRLAAKGKRVNI